MKLGTAAHKELFCRSFLDSHIRYEPKSMDWPQLDAECLARLRGIPFWQVALQTERQAGVMVRAFAETITDPLIREAVALQAEEESRHGRLLTFLINHYGIEVPTLAPIQLSPQIEREFLDFGFSECLDSFFAFGIFELARQTGYFPESLFTLFDPILDEEARHIVFFVNWLTYRQVQNGWGARPFRGIYASWYYGRALSHLVKSFMGASSSNDSEGVSFTAASSGGFLDNLTPEKVFATCLRENQRRMQSFEPELLQPRLFPRLSALALRTLQLLPKNSALSSQGA